MPSTRPAGWEPVVWQRTDSSGNLRIQARTITTAGTLSTTKTLSLATAVWALTLVGIQAAH